MQYKYLGNGRALFQRKSGLRFIVDLKDLGTVNFISTDIYEPDVTFAIEKLLNPGKIFIDVGANLGIHSLEAGRIVKPAGRVHAIEANPQIFKLLRDNVILNGYQGFVHLHEMAAWNAGGVVRFSAEPDTHRVGAVRVKNATNYGSDEVVVEAKRVDQLGIDPPQVGLVKIDVEGREAFVIEGMADLIERSDCGIVAEFVPSLIEETYGLDKFLKLMKDLNRTPYLINTTTNSFDRVEDMPRQHTNLAWLK